MHITQRGIDRGPTFLGPEDHAYYRWALREAASAHGCAVHAYALMTNHVHLLLTPEASDSAAALLQSIGRRYVRYFNDRYRRTGSLWEGRFRSTLVRDTAYLFACSRYIEMNPVRAGLVDHPARYDWSSHRHNALGHPDTTITPRAEYLALANDWIGRRQAYRDLFRAELGSAELADIRADIRGRPVPSSVAYREMLEAAAPGSRFLASREFAEGMPLSRNM